MKFLAIVGSLLFATVLSQTEQAVVAVTDEVVPLVKLEGVANEQKRKVAFKGEKATLQKVQSGGKRLAPQNWKAKTPLSKNKQALAENVVEVTGSQKSFVNRKTRPEISKDVLKKQLLGKAQNTNIKKALSKKGQFTKVERPQKTQTEVQATKEQHAKKGGFQWANKKQVAKSENKIVAPEVLTVQTVQSV